MYIVHCKRALIFQTTPLRINFTLNQIFPLLAFAIFKASAQKRFIFYGSPHKAERLAGRKSGRKVPLVTRIWATFVPLALRIRPVVAQIFKFMLKSRTPTQLACASLHFSISPFLFQYRAYRARWPPSPLLAPFYAFLSCNANRFKNSVFFTHFYATFSAILPLLLKHVIYVFLNASVCVCVCKCHNNLHMCAALRWLPISFFFSISHA